MSEDSTVALLNHLCQIRGYRGSGGEKAIADQLAQQLRAFPWLTVTVEPVCDAEGRVLEDFYNVLAHDGDPRAIELLIVGHLDTVPPSPSWTKPEFSVEDGRYYALGSADARGGIAACLKAIKQIGPTKGVAYLFYGDEEVAFVGMEDFVRQHPEIAPKFGLSLCGGKAEAYLGWRGCIEMEFLVHGVSGHASRQLEGANAAEVIMHVMSTVRDACMAEPTDLETAVNIAAIHVGSSVTGATSADGEGAFHLGGQVAPTTRNIANKIPNSAWALLDVRPGGSRLTAAFIEQVAVNALKQWNEGRKYTAELTVHTNFAMPSYVADREAMTWLLDLFEPVHHGRIKDPGATGFIDVTLISDRHGTQFICLAPDGGNEHAADEYVVVESLEAYRESLERLLQRHAC